MFALIRPGGKQEDLNWKKEGRGRLLSPVEAADKGPRKCLQYDERERLLITAKGVFHNEEITTGARHSGDQETGSCFL